MARETVTDEPGAAPETDSGDQSRWLAGFISSDPKRADTENSNSRYYAPGYAAVAFKKAWKGRPLILPNGEGDDGSF
jgi:hypothetical protein